MLLVLAISSAVIFTFYDVTIREIPGIQRYIPPGTPVSYPANDSPGTGPVSSYTCTVVDAFPHDPDAFTEGLVYEKGVMYEGSGLYGSSTVRKTDLVNGTLIQLRDIPPGYFGEGVTVLGDNLYQLTYESRTIFVYDKDTLDLKKTVNNTPNGWGLTDDGTRLIMSDGSPTLYFLDPGSLAITGRLEVQDRGVPVTRLNELEYVEGEIFANIWQEERIVRISAQNGSVTGWINLTGLTGRVKGVYPGRSLNGIAYDANGKRLFVTGKFLPEILQIVLIPDNPAGAISQ